MSRRCLISGTTAQLSLCMFDKRSRALPQVGEQTRNQEIQRLSLHTSSLLVPSLITEAPCFSESYL